MDSVAEIAAVISCPLYALRRACQSHTRTFHNIPLILFLTHISPFLAAVMASDFRTYLLTEILSEQRTISYRNVARSLKIHVNAAKCILYEYHEEQNKRKGGSLYATYMIAGTKKSELTPETNGRGKVNGHKDDEGDEQMALPSSPPPFTSSMMEPSQQSVHENGVETQAVPVRTIMLVREENLEEVKAQFEEITGLHIYSLSPGKIPDLVALTDIGRGLYADVFSKDDPLLHNKTYGVVLNRDVRRRKGKRPNNPPAAQPKMMPVKEENTKPKPAPAPAAAKSIFAATKPSSTIKKEGTTSRPSSRDSTTTQDKSKPSLKRDASDIFKAFAKSSQKKSSQAKAKEDSQDTKMTDADEEGESEDEALFLDTKTRKSGTKRLSDAKKDRADKASKLRKMMDSDDEAEVQPIEEEAALPQDEPAEKNDVSKEAGEEDVAWSDSDGEGKKENKNEMLVGPRRKRGKRKVMKKRTMKDDEGFLVTKEEEVWEDFSDTDNEEPKKVVKKAFPSKSSAPSSQDKGSQKSAKGGAKKGGGNIMSFFGKK